MVRKPCRGPRRKSSEDIAPAGVLRLAADGSGRWIEFGGMPMIRSGNARAVASLAVVSTLAVLLAGCETTNFSGLLGGSSAPGASTEPGVAPEMPATIRADEIARRWGLASYQDPKDRARTEAMARSQCKQPYTITAGSSGGVFMHLADQATPQELRLKGSPSGKNYIGPAGPTPGEEGPHNVSLARRGVVT